MFVRVEWIVGFSVLFDVFVGSYIVGYGKSNCVLCGLICIVGVLG